MERNTGHNAVQPIDTNNNLRRSSCARRVIHYPIECEITAVIPLNIVLARLARWNVRGNGAITFLVCFIAFVFPKDLHVRLRAVWQMGWESIYDWGSVPELRRIPVGMIEETLGEIERSITEVRVFAKS